MTTSDFAEARAAVGGPCPCHPDGAHIDGAGRVVQITAGVADWNYGRPGRTGDRSRRRNRSRFATTFPPLRVVTFSVPE